eukprot:GHUV01027384.1.p1 GENE.GHUV01027384.1~~GHUV01027384.1.p1  ORF type:complete len:165 (-),score=4.29 GHUV01027384.1:151-645(-)
MRPAKTTEKLLVKYILSAFGFFAFVGLQYSLWSALSNKSDIVDSSMLPTRLPLAVVRRVPAGTTQVPPYWHLSVVASSTRSITEIQTKKIFHEHPARTTHTVELAVPRVVLLIAAVLTTVCLCAHCCRELACQQAHMVAGVPLSLQLRGLLGPDTHAVWCSAGS